jgi:hypothetical protein
MGLLVAIVFGRQTAGLVGVTVALFVGLHLVSRSTTRVPQFDSAVELHDFAVSMGLDFHCGNPGGLYCSNYFLADHPLTLDDLEPLGTRRDCGLTPVWRGILWVSQIRTESMTIHPEQLGGKWRVWGNVVGAGDEDLMDRIEELYRSN